VRLVVIAFDIDEIAAGEIVEQLFFAADNVVVIAFVKIEDVAVEYDLSMAWVFRMAPFLIKSSWFQPKVVRLSFLGNMEVGNDKKPHITPWYAKI